LSRGDHQEELRNEKVAPQKKKKKKKKERPNRDGAGKKWGLGTPQANRTLSRKKKKKGGEKRERAGEALRRRKEPPQKLVTAGLAS